MPVSLPLCLILVSALFGSVPFIAISCLSAFPSSWCLLGISHLCPALHCIFPLLPPSHQYLPLTVSILLLPLLLTFIVLSGESVQVEMHALPRRVVRAAVAGQLFLGAGVPRYVSGGPQVSGPPAEWRRNGQIPVSHTDAFTDAVITDALITDALITDALPDSKRHAQISSRVRCV